MNMMQSVKTCFRKYADFSGRATRSEFWWFFLFEFLVFILFDTFDVEVFSFFPSDDGAETVGQQVFSLLGFSNGLFATLSGVLIFLPSLAVSVRRLHDIGWSGWWLIILYVSFFVDIPFKGLPDSAPETLLVSSVLLLVFLFFCVLWARKGRAGKNKYGHPDGYEETLSAFD